MMRITYAGVTVMTGDEAANTLMDLASALAKHQTSDEVWIRTIQASGEPGVSRFLIGPASQIVITTDVTALAEPDNDDTVAEMRQKIRDLDGYEVRAVDDALDHADPDI
ncbi:hypothetical protein [Diaminobutyricimonas aerilata]|nr:hypothetical protein [Diaminobutyricimonas aerilata]